MRRIASVVLTALLAPGCALIDGLFGADNVSSTEFCERLVPKLTSCGDDVTPAQCERTFTCLDRARVEGCEGEWRDAVRCAFDDAVECGGPDGPFPCEGAITSFLSCAEERGVAVDCFGDAGPEPPCDPSRDPGCEDPCAERDCPPGTQCVDGDCVGDGEPGALCTEQAECDPALVCVSPAELCSLAGMASGSVCATLEQERRCRAPCGGDEGCLDGERCYLVVPIEGDERRGVCAPGGCDDDGDCTEGSCVDRDNGPGSGFCAAPCDVAACVAGEGCGACPSGSCQALSVDATDADDYACLGDATISRYSTCEGTGHYGCEGGYTCVQPSPGALPLCLSYCRSDADCDDGERCETAPSPNGGVCVRDDEACACAGNEDCDDARLVCEGLVASGLALASCDFAPSGEQCHARCTRDGSAPCTQGSVCLPLSATSNDGLCVPSNCAQDADCAAELGCVHLGGSGANGGICAAECRASSCEPGIGCASCPELGSQCRLLPRADQALEPLDVICAAAGTLGIGAPCDPSAPECAAGLGCVDVEGASVCAELCGPSRACNGGGECTPLLALHVDEPDDVSGVCVVAAPPVCPSCTGGDVCANGHDACLAAPTVNPFQRGCPWTDFDGCAIGCDVATPSSCAASARCVEEPFSGQGFCLFGECNTAASCDPNQACVADGTSQLMLCAERCDPLACAHGPCNCPLERPACTAVPELGTADLTFVCAEATSTTLHTGDACVLGAVGCPAGTLCALDTAGAARCMPLCDDTGPCPGQGQCAPADTGGFTHPGVSVCALLATIRRAGEPCDDDALCQSNICLDVDESCATLSAPTDEVCESPPLEPSQRLCRTACDDGECPSGTRCYFDTVTLRAVCAEPRCTVDADCGGGLVCADGVCGAPCDPAACLTGAESCGCDPDEACTSLSSDSVPPYVCRNAGTLAIGSPCTLHEECAGAAMCVLPSEGATSKICAPLCANDDDCGAGVCAVPAGAAIGTCR